MEEEQKNDNYGVMVDKIEETAKRMEDLEKRFTEIVAFNRELLSRKAPVETPAKENKPTFEELFGRRK